MPRLGARANVNLGVNGVNQGGPSTGWGQSDTALYGGRMQAPDHVITGELLALVFIEMFLLGWIRFSFARNFGG